MGSVVMKPSQIREDTATSRIDARHTATGMSWRAPTRSVPTPQREEPFGGPVHHHPRVEQDHQGAAAQLAGQ